MQFNCSSRVQVVSAHGETTQDHITLVDGGHVATGDLHLRSDSFHTTSGFTLEDETAGVSEFGFFTVLVVDTGNIVSSIFNVRTRRYRVLPGLVVPGLVAEPVPILGTVLGEERNVHGLVDLDTSDLHNALSALQTSALLVTVDQSVVTDLLDQGIVLTGVQDAHTSILRHTLFVHRSSGVEEGGGQFLSIVSVRSVGSSTNTDLSATRAQRS